MNKKKLLVILAFFLTATTMMAQYNVFARMHAIPNGHPKQVILNDGMEVDEFDAQGRVTSARYGEYEFQYEWDENSVTIQLYMNGLLQTSDIVTVVSNTPDKIILTAESGIKTTCFFNHHGIVTRTVVEGEGQNMVIENKFRSPEDIFPYETVQTAGTMSDRCSYSDWRTDSQGNWSQQTVTYGDQSVTQTRTIIYY